MIYNMFPKLKMVFSLLIILVICLTTDGLSNLDNPRCTEDCTGLKFIQGEKEYVVNCQTQTRQKSFCNKITNECDTALNKCTTPNQFCSFGDGYYPDLEFCTKYYFCANGQRIIYDCPKGTVYNPINTICESGAKCLSFHPLKLCNHKIGTMINHPMLNNYYIFCGTEPVLFKCPYKQFKMDVNKGNCDFFCEESGWFFDPREGMNEWYFECVDNNGTFLTFHKHCPKDTSFDPELSKCVNK